MTNQTTILDRLIQVPVTTTRLVIPTGEARRYDRRLDRVSASGTGIPGTFYLTGVTAVSPFSDYLLATMIQLARADADDVDLPVLDLPYQVKFSWGDGRSLTFNVEASRKYFNGGFGFEWTVADVTATGDIGTPPPAGDVTLHVGGGGVAVAVKVEEEQMIWARRRDLGTSDERLLSDQFNATKDDTLYTIRAGLGYAPAVDDKLVDEAGLTRTVIAIAEVGRRRYFNLVARAVV